MNPPPSPPFSPINFSNDLLEDIANFDFDTSFMDPLFPPIEETMPHGYNESSIFPAVEPSDHADPHLSLNTHIPTSTLAPTIPLQPNAVSVDNFGSGLADPIAMQDQIQVSATHPIEYYQSVQNSVSQSLQGIPNELAPQMNFHTDTLLQDSLLPRGNFFPGQNPHQPILPSYFSTPNPSADLGFSMNAFQPPVSHFATQTVPANPANHQPSSSSVPERQLPREEYSPPPKSVTVSSGTNFVSTMDDIMSNDPEGIACFLAGIVRPGPGCSIYKCSTCFVEFPNAQAFGGHMKSHAKRKAKAKGDGKGKGKRTKASSKGKRSKASKKKSSESEEDD